MAGEKDKPDGGRATGYHHIDTDAVISVDEVTRQAQKMAEGVSVEKVAELAKNAPFVSIEHLNAGYGKMEILHDFSLQVGATGAWSRARTGTTTKGHGGFRAMPIGGALPIKG